jgi:hypothetical protein
VICARRQDAGQRGGQDSPLPLSCWLASACSVGLEPADLRGAVAVHGGHQLAVLADDPQGRVGKLDGDGLAGVVMPAWMRWRAAWMPPRLETFRWMVRAGCGSRSDPARRTPCSLCRWPGGMGQGRVRYRMPSWVMTCMTWPSMRIRARWPASGEPAWMT